MGEVKARLGQLERKYGPNKIWKADRRTDKRKDGRTEQQIFLKTIFYENALYIFILLSKKNDRISAHIKNKYGAPEFADLQLLCNFMSNCIDKKPLCKMHAF